MARIRKLSEINLNEKAYHLAGIIIACAISAVFIYNINNDGRLKSPPSPTRPLISDTSSDPYAVLSPATVASKTAECSQSTTINSDGTSSPLTCSNGDINSQAWSSLSALEPSVMSLGYSATESQVQAAICNDINVTLSDANTKNSHAVETQIYQISALYYGWNFSAALNSSTC